MFKKNKKGIEVSINFLITIIIAIIVLVAGIAFAARFFGKAETIRAQVDEKTKSQLESLIIGQGAKVAVYPSQLSIYRGQRDSFGIGINNVIGSRKTFTISATTAKFINTSQLEETTAGLNSKIVLTYLKSQIIENNKDEIVPVAVQANTSAKSGTYVVNVNVNYDGSTQYGDAVYKVYVTVP